MEKSTSPLPAPADEAAAHPVASGLTDALALGGSKVAQAALALVGLKVLLKATTETDYSEYQAFLLLSNTLMALLAWPTGSVLRLGADEWLERRALGRTFALHAILFLGTCALLTGPIWQARDVVDGYVEVAGSTLIVLLYASSGAAGNMFAAHLKPAVRVASFSYIPLVGRVLWVASLGWYWFAHRAIDARLAMILCLVMTGLPQLALALALLARHAWPPSWPREGDASRAVRFGLPVVVKQLSLIAFTYVNYVWIRHAQRGLVDAGRFQIAAQLTDQSVILVVALEDLMGPILARAAAAGEERTLATYYRTIAPQVVLLASAAFGAALVVAGPILELLSAKAVAETAPALQVLLLATAVRVVLTLETPVFDAHLISRPPLVAFGIGFATNLALDVVLVPRYGIEGAAWATLAGWLVNAVLRSGYLGARFRVRALGLYVRLLPIALAFGYARLAGGNAIADAAVAALLVPLTFLAGRATGVLSPDTMSALEGVRMPDALRRALARAYGASR